MTNTLITRARDALRSNPEEQAKEWDKEMAAYRGSYAGIVKYQGIQASDRAYRRVRLRGRVLRGEPDVSRHGPDEVGSVLGAAVTTVLLCGWSPWVTVSVFP